MSREPQATEVSQDHREAQEQQASQVLQASQGLMVAQVLQVRQETPAPQAFRGPLVTPGIPALQELQEPLVHQVSMVSQVPRARRVL